MSSEHDLKIAVDQAADRSMIRPVTRPVVDNATYTAIRQSIRPAIREQVIGRVDLGVQANHGDMATSQAACEHSTPITLRVANSLP